MKKSEYVTYDIGLTAFLVVAGYNIISIKKTEKNISSFQFNGSDSISADILRYYNRNVSVEPVTFLQQIKNLKAMISSGSI